MGAHDLLVQEAVGPRSSEGHLSHPEPGSGSQRPLCCLCPAGPLRPISRLDSGPAFSSALLLLGAHLFLSLAREPNPTARPHWSSLWFPLPAWLAQSGGPCGPLSGTARSASSCSPSRSPLSWTLCRRSGPATSLSKNSVFFALQITGGVVLALGELLYFNALYYQSSSLLSSTILRTFILTHKLLVIFYR